MDTPAPRHNCVAILKKAGAFEEKLLPVVKDR